MLIGATITTRVVGLKQSLVSFQSTELGICRQAENFS
jgi:hypothetical protein